MKSAHALETSIGLAFRAGPIAFRFLAVALTALVLPIPAATAQEYIDVEAERRAAQSGENATGANAGDENATGANAPGGAVSYGIGDIPAEGVTRTLPPPAPPAADNIGGLFNQVQQLQQEVMRLNGIVEQQAYELRQLKEQSLERYLDIDRRLASGAALPGGASAAAGAAPAASRQPSSATAVVAEQPGEAEAYRAAYALVRGQEFDAAVTAFTRFLQNFPDGRYTPNAHYWLGELYLVIEPADPEAARQSFMLLLGQYPDNAKVPDALYKLGRVHYIKGNPDRAREFLDRVRRDYPDSSAAQLAGDFIDQNL